MRILQAHRGREQAMPREKLRERLNIFNADIDDRKLRKLYVVLPICSCAEGLFIPDYVNVAKGRQEVADFKAYIAKQSGPIVAAQRVGTVLAFYPMLKPLEERQPGLFEERRILA